MAGPFLFKKTPYTYVVKGVRDGRLYKGVIDSLNTGSSSIIMGKTSRPKAFLPWGLYYFEEFDTRIGVSTREKYFKSGSGREFLKLIKSATE